MKDSPVMTLVYKKNPFFYTVFNFSVVVILALYASGVITMLDKGNLLLFSFFFLPLPIMIILFHYAPVFSAITKYRKLEIFEDRVIIDLEEYYIKDIKCDIEVYDKHVKIISIAWTKCILRDCEDRIVGEFVFRIGGINGFFDVTANGLKELFGNLKQKSNNA